MTTPGHAPGHQSLIVRGLPNTGTVILSSDAAHSHVEFEEERRDPTHDEETVETMLASIRKLKRIRDAENATLLLNHDADHWYSDYRLLPGVLRLSRSRSASAPKPRPSVAQMHACVPSEASRKCQSVSAGKPFGTSWTPGSMRAAPVTSTT